MTRPITRLTLFAGRLVRESRRVIPLNADPWWAWAIVWLCAGASGAAVALWWGVG